MHLRVTTGKQFEQLLGTLLKPFFKIADYVASPGMTVAQCASMLRCS